MTEITDRITPEMSEEEVLGVILDEIMARAEPDVAEAIRFCAIPHWFNEEIIAWLRGEGLKPSQRSREILAALTELTFVGPYRDRGWAYHENVRDLLLRWWERDSEEFRELSGRAADYFEQKAEAAADEEHDEWEREQMYHLLVADEERGLEQLQSMFAGARDFYQLSTCTLLLQLAAEQSDHLSRDSQLWTKYLKGELTYYSVQWTEAQGVLEELMGQELPPSLEPEVIQLLGMVYEDKGEWDRAIEYYERSLAIKEKVGDEHGMATSFNSLGNVYSYKGEWDRAIEYYERDLAVCEKVGDEYGMATTFNNLGSVYQDMGEWDQAIECYEHSLAICEKVSDEYGMAAPFNNLAEVYRVKGEWDRAIEYYERSLAIKEKVGDEYGMAPTFNNLGVVYQDKGEWDRATEYYERSLAILEKVGDEYGTATTFNNLGEVYRVKGEWERAIEYYERSLAIYEKVGDEYGMAPTFNNLGLLYEDKGEWDRAIEYYERSLAIREKVGDKVGAATTMYNIALLYEDLGRYDGAVKLLERVVEIDEQVGHPDLESDRETLERVRRKAK
jgi:tetratricopeptide (TPR) repeat protein